MSSDSMSFGLVETTCASCGSLGKYRPARITIHGYVHIDSVGSYRTLEAPPRTQNESPVILCGRCISTLAQSISQCVQTLLQSYSK